MGSLSVRKLDDETLERLRIQAAEHGVSMEEEARRIISRAVTAPRKLGDLAIALFGQERGTELESMDRTPHGPMVIDH
jgi:antitoxin FitA